MRSITASAAARGHVAAAFMLVSFVCSLAIPAAAQHVQVTARGDAFEVQYTAEWSATDVQFGRLAGYDTVSLGDTDQWAEPGQPLVPVQVVRIAVPAGMRVTAVQAVASQTIELPGTYRLYPAQPPQKLSAAAQQFVTPDLAAYASAAPSPPETATLLQEADLAGQALAVVRLCPLHYVAATGKLTLITQLELRLDGVAGYICGDYLPPHLSPASQQEVLQELRSMVINPDDVLLQSAGAGAGPCDLPAGDYDYVIITPTNWVSAFQPLADWKTKKGVPANIVDTTWIYANYTGSNNAAKVKAFVQDAYQTWGTTFFLLGGDTAYVPFNTRTFSSVDPNPVPNDTYYADFDADWVCEVHVGRASVINTGSTAGGIAAFINKVLTFEKNPPLTNYAKKAGMFGFDLDSSTHAEQCKTNIANANLSGWTKTNVYDSQSSNHQTNTIAAINAGQMLLNHADHSASDFMGLGYNNHGWGLTNSSMDALTNGARQGIFYSMGCDPAAYDSDNCIAEHFVRNVNGGGLAFVGNSRYGWYNTGMYNTYSMRYDVAFFAAIFAQGHTRLGDAFSAHKNSFTPNDDYYRYCYTELTLLGDPEVPIWTDNPQTLTATVPSTLPAGAPSTFAVQVTSNGQPLAAARVCLWKTSDVYLVGQTDGSGTASFTVDPNSAGTLAVTVSKQNYLPFEGSANVTQGTFTVQVNIVGQGSVILDPPGGSYGAGTSVQLTAEPATAWRFDHWSGDAHGTDNPTTVIVNGNLNVTATFFLIGDMNCSGAVDFDDINPFVTALSSQAEYEAQYPNCAYLNADCNLDGVVNFDDITPFVELLIPS